MKEQKNKKSETGITLIALVVSIIVLIILAGVSIAMLVGENGIITQAQRADELTTQAQQKEAIELAIASVQAQGTLELDKAKLETALQSQLGDTAYTLTENGDGSFLLQIGERSYYIDSTGEVITEENMIAIGSAEELKAFRDDVNSGNSYEGKYVYLTNNITLDINEEWQPIGLYLNENSSPTDETNIPFKGIFDGNGYEIDGIYINTTDKAQGLFGLINDGKVMNLSIGENCNITGGRASAALVGYAYSGSIISNCSNNTNINVAFGGGIVGCADRNVTVINCNNKGIINGTNNIGGITGYISNATIKRCYNIANITGQSTVGGICGASVVATSTDSNVIECYNVGNIESTSQNTNGNSNVGGILGLNYISIVNCFNVGTVSGLYNNIGGIVGLNRGTLENSYNRGNVSGSVDYIGGVAGTNSEFYSSGHDTTYIGKIYNCYSLEGVTEKLIGNNNSIMGDECSFKTNLELQNLYTTLGEGFKEDINNINNGYPILAWQ